MNLSPHFTLAEMTKTQVRGVDNTPTDEIQGRLALLCEKILEPVRAHYNKPVTVNSGYRCLEVNRAIGSKDTSQHIKGEAVDFEIHGIDNYELASWCRDNLTFDQVILEFHESGVPSSGWVHASYATVNRSTCLTINKGGTQAGLVK